MRFWIIYISLQVYTFGTALGRFSQCFFLIFGCQQTMVANIFTQTLIQAAY